MWRFTMLERARIIGTTRIKMPIEFWKSSIRISKLHQLLPKTPVRIKSVLRNYNAKKKQKSLGWTGDSRLVSVQQKVICKANKQPGHIREQSTAIKEQPQLYVQFATKEKNNSFSVQYKHSKPFPTEQSPSMIIVSVSMMNNLEISLRLLET